jgi:hypothetical protein
MHRTSPILALLTGLPLVLAACGDSGSTSSTTGTGGSSSTTTTTTTTTTGTGGTGGSGGSTPTFVEKSVTVGLALTDKVLTITVKDGATPVLTDVWLYTLEGGSLKPLTAFQKPDSARKHAGLMMPCTVGGADSGLVPCDKGELNGVMTGIVREKIVDGKAEPDIDGMVEVTLDAAPASPIVVVAAVEDQRYAGAAGIDPAGKSVAVPEGVGAPETHRVVTYADVEPIFKTRCVSCHSSTGMTPQYPMETYDEIANFNFAFAEEEAACNEQFPNDPAGLEACKKGITGVEFMIELGAPALSPLMRRTRPDEEKGASATGIAWFGKSGSRFGSGGDRRMPPSNTTPDMGDDDPKKASYFDNNLAEYQLLWDWVSQGAPK